MMEDRIKLKVGPRYVREGWSEVVSRRKLEDMTKISQYHNWWFDRATEFAGIIFEG